jgi:hypothetical protein
MTMLRVKNGACAPERLSNISSCPATGTTSISVIFGDDVLSRSLMSLIAILLAILLTILLALSLCNTLTAQAAFCDGGAGLTDTIGIGILMPRFVLAFHSAKIAAPPDFSKASP